MDFMLGLILKLGIALFAVSGVYVGHKYFKMKDHNIIEKVVEEGIKEELGIDIDLSEDNEDRPMQSGYNPDGTEVDHEKSPNNVSCITQQQLADIEAAVDKKIEELKRIENNQQLEK